jgi:hypothetical protein
VRQTYEIFFPFQRIEWWTRRCEPLTPPLPVFVLRLAVALQGPRFTLPWRSVRMPIGAKNRLDCGGPWPMTRSIPAAVPL